MTLEFLHFQNTTTRVFDSMEARLRAAWCQVLDMEDDELDGDSHFFREGGDSVAAIRLISVAQDYKIQLDNALIYGFPILKDMASNSHEIQVVSDTATPDAGKQDLDEDLVQECAKVCKVERQAIEDIFPSVDVQEMLFNWHLQDGSAMLQYVFQIHGPARKDRIRKVIDVIQQKNQILRTRMVPHNGILYQVVVRDTVEWYEGTDLSAYRSHVFSKDGRVGYGDPLYRYAFIEEGRDLYFACTAHHSGYDRWSHHIMFDALEEGLHDLEGLRQKPAPTQFKQLSKWLEHRSEAKDKTAKSTAFWHSYIEGFQGLPNRFGVTLDEKPYVGMRFTKIMPFKRRPSAFAFSTMAIAAWMISLGNIFQHDDILTISATSGRRFPRDDPLPKVETMMGPLAMAIFIRARLQADQAIVDFLRDLQDTILSAIPHERESLKTVAEALGPLANTQSLFNWHPIGDDIPARVIDFEGDDGSTTRLEGRRDIHTPIIVPIQLGVDVWEHHDHLRIDAKWNSNIYDDSVAAMCVDQLMETLSKIAASKVKTVGDVWKIKDNLGNGHADGHRIDQSETFVTAPAASKSSDTAVPVVLGT